MSAYHTVAFASIAQFWLGPTADSHSAISPASGLFVNSGGSQTFTYSANTGYLISSCLVDGSSVSITGSYAFSGVSTYHTISVTSGLYSSAMTVTINSWLVNNILNFSVTSPTLTSGTVKLELLSYGSPVYLLNVPYNLATAWNSVTGVLTLTVPNGTTVIGNFNTGMWGAVAITESDSAITSLGWTAYKPIFTVNTQGAGGTFSIDVGSRGQPQTISGLTASYNSTTDILSGTYGANAVIVLDWTVAPSGQNNPSPTPYPQATATPNWTTHTPTPTLSPNVTSSPNSSNGEINPLILYILAGVFVVMIAAVLIAKFKKR
jgi:hypothetical protein